MTKLDRIKEEYAKIIKKTLEANKSILIDSFVEYYGEEYRSLIEERYEKITFVYYIDWDIVDKVLSSVEMYKNNQSDYKKFKELDNAKNSLFEKINNIFRKKDKRYTNLVGMTKEIDLTDRLLYVISQSNAMTHYGKNVENVILFQILSFSEEVIIHEINHALTVDNLFYRYEKNEDAGRKIRKFGIDVYENEKLCEELLNEKASIDITKIFKRKGGDLSSFCLNIPILTYWYQENFYLIDEFYDSFKDLLKQVRISLDKNALIKRVGKYNYYTFCDLINTYFSTDFEWIPENKIKVESKIHGLVETMKRNAEYSKDFTQEEMNSFYHELEVAGYDVTPLRDIDEGRSR